jgi:ABC-type glycerol-3-phosphate transport system permease component
LEEAAEMDGAGYLSRFFLIVLPLSKPILATVGLFSAVSQWNSIFDTKLYITNSKLYTLQFVLYEYYNQIKSIQQTMDQMGGSELVNAASTTSVRLTMTAVTVIPVMCIYPFIQKYYMKGIMIGAVKG